jgi:quinoprotein relay system zinc metallohydrolase 2
MVIFEILVAACLTAQPDICADRLIPLRAPDAAACQSAAPEAVAAWTARHEGLAVSAWRCSAEAPALDVGEIAPGVFVHEGQIAVPSSDNAGDTANLGFVVGAEAVAVIDAGGSREVGERLYAAIKAQTDLPIEWVIITHMHPDHSLGAQVFAEAGAKVVGHPKLADALANRAETYLTSSERLLGPAALIATKVAAPAPAPRKIDLGGRLLLVATYRTAHTDNDVTVLDAETGTLFAGDLVFSVHTPALDGSIKGWRGVLADLMVQTYARVTPGHGPIALTWPGGGAPVADYLDAIIGETRAAVAAGERISDAIRHVGEGQRRNWKLFDEFNARNATAAFQELEWE